VIFNSLIQNQLVQNKTSQHMVTLNRQYAGKIVLITGASSGIGEALAKRFADLGANLVLVARRKERLDQLARDIQEFGVESLCCQADISRDGEVEDAVKFAIAKFGRIDVVVAGAGFAVAGNLEKLSLLDYRNQFETNVFGVLRTIYTCMPELKKTSGRLAIIGSVVSEISMPHDTAYCMSKHALAGLADGLRAELNQYGISLTFVLPGFVDTGIHRVNNNNEPETGRDTDPPPKLLLMPPAQAAKVIEKAITARRNMQVVTIHARVVLFINRLFPGIFAWALRNKPARL
jgi:short-subunit dehydrogenase